MVKKYMFFLKLKKKNPSYRNYLKSSCSNKSNLKVSDQSIIKLFEVSKTRSRSDFNYWHNTENVCFPGFMS